jgi:hypothetical protein
MLNIYLVKTMIYKNFIRSLFILPLILLSLNIFDIYFPKDYRSDQHLINGYFSKENKKILNYISEENRNEILKYKDAIKKFDELFFVHGESLKFLNKAAKVYFIAKVPSEYSWKEKYTKVKFQENWVLYFFRKFEEIQINYTQKSEYNGAYIYYQSSDYKHALKRGISICSQDAVSFANLLKRRYNINYNIVGLDGHVLMQAKINDKYYLSDPNMGLTFDFSIDEYYNNDKNHLKIKNAYTAIGRPDLINSFDKLGNRKFKYTGPKSKENTYNPDTITFFSNYIKWLLPMFILLTGFYLRYKKHKV